jgi:hypothetical protein
MRVPRMLANWSVVAEQSAAGVGDLGCAARVEVERQAGARRINVVEDEVRRSMTSWSPARMPPTESVNVVWAGPRR